MTREFSKNVGNLQDNNWPSLAFNDQLKILKEDINQSEEKMDESLLSLVKKLLLIVSVPKRIMKKTKTDSQVITLRLLGTKCSTGAFCAKDIKGNIITYDDVSSESLKNSKVKLHQEVEIKKGNELTLKISVPFIYKIVRSLLTI